MNSDGADTWDRMLGWQVVLPPSRPDALDLQRIAQALVGLDLKAPVGVLGSTPEFRDLLHELGFESIHVLERNLAYFDHVSAQRVYDNPETIVEGDWMATLPRLGGRFSVLLSDLTAGNVAYEQRREFYDGVAHALSHEGLFIDKNLTNPDGLLSIDDIDEKYRLKPFNLQTVNYFSCEAVFCSELQGELGYLDTSAVYSALSSRLNGARLQRFVAAATAVTPTGCIWYYGRPWRDLKDDYCRSLELEHRYDLEPTQPYFRRAHQYIWRKP